MGWASHYIEQLANGEIIQCRPGGNSMSGIIESGQLCTIIPIKDELKVGDIVLCKVKGRQYLHLIKAINGNRYQIGNNRGGINGWTSRKSIFGLFISAQ